MSQVNLHKTRAAKALLVVIALLMFTEPAWAIFGVWRRAAFRTAVVATSVATSEAAAASANAAHQEAAAQQAAAASAQQSAAASAASAAAAQQAAAAAQTAQKSPQQKLKELQSLYDQKLISQSDYQAAKTKILNEMTQ